MKSIGIKELKSNPGLISKTIEAGEYLLISKRGKPIAIATSLDDKVLDMGLKKWILIDSFKQGALSLGQLSRALDISYMETVELLDLLKIPVLDYDLKDDLTTLA